MNAAHLHEQAVQALLAKSFYSFQKQNQTQPKNCSISCLFGSLEYFH